MFTATSRGPTEGPETWRFPVWEPHLSDDEDMAKKVPQPRSKQLPTRLGNLNTMRLTERLRELHRLGDDPRLEQFPDPAELFLVLRHAEQMASQLTQPANSPINVVGEAALLRAQMWQYLREQADCQRKL